MTRHVMITALETRQSACLMTGGRIPAHSHMSSPEPSRAKPLWGVMQVNGRAGGLSRRMWTLSITCACVFMRISLCLHVCLLLNRAVAPVNRSVEAVWAVLLCQFLRSPLTHGLLGSLGTQTAAMPSHNSSAKPWISQEEVWYHETRTSLTVNPRWTSSRRLRYPEPDFGPFKSKDLSHFFSSAKARGQQLASLWGTEIHHSAL